MNLNRIIRLANIFCSLAESELNDLPKDSENKDTILFNIEQLETYQARKEYAEENLEHLSSGSSRIVYLSPDKSIIKIAKNDKGIAQNKAEANPKMKSDYLNKIISHAKNYSWIETNYLDKISEKEFEDMTDIKFDDFGSAIRYILKDENGSSESSSYKASSTKKKPSKFIENSKIFKEIARIGKEFDLVPGDIARISSWGKKDGHPVLIDAGLTREIFEEFYEDSSS